MVEGHDEGGERVFRAASGDVTGRDDDLIAQALHLAAKHIDLLPASHRSQAMRDDMLTLLERRFPGRAAHFMLMDDLARARRLGWRSSSGTVSHDEIREFLARSPGAE